MHLIHVACSYATCKHGTFLTFTASYRRHGSYRTL